MIMVQSTRHKVTDNGNEPLLNDRPGQEMMAHFGYKEVPEKDKVKRVLRHFDIVAKKYDMMNTLLSFGIHYLWKRTAIKMLKLKEGQDVIDVCGGTGDLTLSAAKAVGLSGRVVLYDINRSMMEMGRPKALKSPYGKIIHYVEGDAEEISFESGSFDAAMVGFGIRNLTHMEWGFSEMYRILKPSGKLMCLEFSQPTAPIFRWLYDFYSFHIMPLLGELIVGSRQAYTYLPESIKMFSSPEELSGMLKRIGFSQVTYRKLTNGIAVIHLAKKGK
jgi:demethylmenaquinone methyltransferase/2-methoxy-6-polyprenyl-1,4-benzoquinol methylase